MLAEFVASTPLAILTQETMGAYIHTYRTITVSLDLHIHGTRQFSVSNRASCVATLRNYDTLLPQLEIHHFDPNTAEQDPTRRGLFAVRKEGAQIPAPSADNRATYEPHVLDEGTPIHHALALNSTSCTQRCCACAEARFPQADRQFADVPGHASMIQYHANSNPMQLTNTMQ
ncbi:unnamed protein product [Prorocentrum cordatum]|uniref:Uncharacterized protein n=1 Tax=Prorocentrum cordatum TaxID=2364126 RepID=A0ABN9Y2F0_9DINO|nr:unnamed protein product [Polarella glacialis]